MATEDTIEDLNRSFESAWEANKGPEQSQFFMRLLLAHIPSEIKAEIHKLSNAVDLGCALGDGTVEFYREFLTLRVWGADISEVATRKARERLARIPNVNFMHADMEHMAAFSDVQGDESRFDVVISSNVLEHFSQPLLAFRDMARVTRRYLLILTPYNEHPLIPGHRASINDFTLPEDVTFPSGESDIRLKRVFKCIVPTGKNPYWFGDQFLQIYERQETES